MGGYNPGPTTPEQQKSYDAYLARTELVKKYGLDGKPAVASNIRDAYMESLTASGAQALGAKQAADTAIPDDATGLMLRKTGAGRVRLARGGSLRSSYLGQAFDPTTPLGRGSIMGDY